MKLSRARICAALLLCTGVALGACTTTGAGDGAESPSGAPVRFSWKSTDGGATGTLSVTLADGRTFYGPYVQITSEARSNDLEPMWRGWPYRWSDWDLQPAFATVYSGRVMANLRTADGQRLRCRIYLTDPAEGMAGGGQGTCRLANGVAVDAVFPRA